MKHHREHGEAMECRPILRAVQKTPVRCLALAATMAVGLGASGFAHAATPITNCDPDSIAEWKFSNGSEFPGAAGSLRSGTGYVQAGAHLEYDLSAGGKYVAATLALATPMTGSAVGLWLQSSLDAQPQLQLRDASGQTLVYDLVRPLEATAVVQDWYHLLVDIAAPTDHFGGANDGTPHSPFSLVAMVVSAASGTKGSVDFDQLEMLDSFSTTLDPQALPLIATEPAASNLISRLAVNVHGAHEPRALDAARDIGFRTVRVDLLWESLERTRGNYDFSELDSLVAGLESRGMRLHLILDYGNDLYPDPTSEDYSRTTIPAFAQMVRAIAGRFAGKGLSYEIWNEPNGERFWPVSAGPSVYANLAKAATQAIHESDPLAQVSTGGVSGFDYEFVTASLSAGASLGANAIGVHPYRRGGGESVGNDLLRLRTLVAQTASAPLPIWATEWGYTSTWEGDGHGSTERGRQAQLAVREILSAWAAKVPLIVYYELRDDGNDPTDAEHNFGLLQYDYANKPAVVAVRTLIHVASERAFVGLLDTGISGLHALRLNGARDVVVALWSERTAREITVKLPSNATVADLLGATRTTLKTGNEQELKVKESDGPCYVTFALPGSATGGAGGTGQGAATGGNSSATTGGIAGMGGAAAGGNPSASGGEQSASHGGQASIAGAAAGGRTGADSTSGGSAGSNRTGAGESSTAGAATEQSPASSGCDCALAPPARAPRDLGAAVAVLAGLAVYYGRRRTLRDRATQHRTPTKV